MRVLTTQQSVEWKDYLHRSASHDFYHLPSYHALAESRGEGSARLFVYETDGAFVAMPLLLRKLSSVTGLEQVGEDFLDATSVYGYSGPVFSQLPPDTVVTAFSKAFRAELEEARVVSAFSRLHPLLNQAPLLEKLGECRSAGPTVSINLSAAPGVQTGGYRKGHRDDIKKLRQKGIRVVHDESRGDLAEFIDIYLETMRRVGAAADYFFDRTYFDRLISSLGDAVHLFTAKLEDELLAGALFVACRGILQYHLAGTRAEFAKFAPMKLILDEARAWGSEHGLTTFHLGGGVGGNVDPLFLFKAGFSPERHDFQIWRSILLPETYEQLCQARNTWMKSQSRRFANSDFFPLYRAPLIAV